MACFWHFSTKQWFEFFENLQFKRHPISGLGVWNKIKWRKTFPRWLIVTLRDDPKVKTGLLFCSLHDFACRSQPSVSELSLTKRSLIGMRFPVPVFFHPVIYSQLEKNNFKKKKKNMYVFSFDCWKANCQLNMKNIGLVFFSLELFLCHISFRSSSLCSSYEKMDS